MAWNGFSYSLYIHSVVFQQQFKSVIEEDDEDIDEDDVADEELAQLVAMATALTESEEDTDTETEAPEGERGAAVGSDSTSEASTNTPMHVSHSYFPAKRSCLNLTLFTQMSAAAIRLPSFSM